jgi:hypothetical protein
MSARPLNRPPHKPVFDVSREDLLSAVIPGFTADKPRPQWAVGGVFPRPQPRIRNHWTHLRQWHSFGQNTNLLCSIAKSDPLCRSSSTKVIMSSQSVEGEERAIYNLSVYLEITRKCAHLGKVTSTTKRTSKYIV